MTAFPTGEDPHPDPFEALARQEVSPETLSALRERFTLLAPYAEREEFRAQQDYPCGEQALTISLTREYGPTVNDLIAIQLPYKKEYSTQYGLVVLAKEFGNRDWHIQLEESSDALDDELAKQFGITPNNKPSLQTMLDHLDDSQIDEEIKIIIAQLQNVIHATTDGRPLADNDACTALWKTVQSSFTTNSTPWHKTLEYTGYLDERRVSLLANVPATSPYSIYEQPDHSPSEFQLLVEGDFNVACAEFDGTTDYYFDDLTLHVTDDTLPELSDYERANHIYAVVGRDSDYVAYLVAYPSLVQARFETHQAAQEYADLQYRRTLAEQRIDHSLTEWRALHVIGTLDRIIDGAKESAPTDASDS